MSWHSTMSPPCVDRGDRVDPVIERMARQLASQADVNWDRLSHHPGVERNQWREQASRLLAAAA
jgi:hypothetical protein